MSKWIGIALWAAVLFFCVAAQDDCASQPVASDVAQAEQGAHNIHVVASNRSNYVPQIWILSIDGAEYVAVEGCGVVEKKKEVPK